MQVLTIQRTAARDLALVLFASLIICLSGSLSIPLWFTPVPLVLQNATVLLVAALLGSRRGVAATFAFLAQGAMGLPVFANKAAGFGCFFGPTGGYLIGYLIAAAVVGYIAEKRQTMTSALSALVIGNFLIYFSGVCHLSTFIGIAKAISLGAIPFILGDSLKILCSLQILKWAGWSRV